MAAAEETPSDAVPPPGEQVHLPGPSFLPVLVALGVSIAILGVLVNIVVVAFGMIIFLVATFKWIREAREEMAALPLEHHGAP